MNTVATEMIKYYAGDKKRINHFIKVHGYAKAIGEAEGLDERTMLILETAAYVHDIGIKISEEKYNSSAGKYQEIEGPPIAEEMLTNVFSRFFCHFVLIYIDKEVRLNKYLIVDTVDI